jgi:hypothetical protein
MSNKYKAAKVEMEKDSKSDQTTAYVSRISTVGNVLIALSALSYAFGFIVVNTYLSIKYGIYNFEILNARYVYSGASFLLLCLLAYFGASLVSSRMEKIQDKPFLQKIFQFIIWLSVAHGLYVTIFYSILVVALNRGPSAFFSLPSEIPMTLWLGLAIIVFYIQISLYKSKSWETLPHEVPFPSSVFTSIIILALIYGVYFYFFLPPSVGGGLPTPITLIIDKSKVEIAQHILPVTSQNPSATVYLIEQNSNSYYVLVGSRFNSASDSVLLPIQVDKSLIAGIVYPNEIRTSKYLDTNNITFPPTATPTITPIASPNP